jgi:hypothetical protein
VGRSLLGLVLVAVANCLEFRRSQGVIGTQYGTLSCWEWIQNIRTEVVLSLHFVSLVFTAIAVVDVGAEVKLIDQVEFRNVVNIVSARLQATEIKELLCTVQ